MHQGLYCQIIMYEIRLMIHPTHMYSLMIRDVEKIHAGKNIMASVGRQ